MSTRIRLAAAAAAAAALASPLIVPTAAEAAVTGYSATVQYIGGGSYVNVRSRADIASSVAYTVLPGAGLSIDCQTVGSRLGFSAYADNRTWDRLSDGNYVSDVVTTTPGGSRQYRSDGGYTAYSPDIPQCAAPAPAPAVASTTYTATSQYIGGGSTLNVRQSADISSAVAYTVPNGTGIQIVCQTTGSRLGFSAYADNRTWDQLADGHWIHDVVTSTPGGARSYPSDGGYTAFTSSLPQCSTGGGSSAPVSTMPSVGASSSAAANAVAWAQAQVGQLSSTDASIGAWSGNCEIFVEQAYGTRGRYLTATADGDAQSPLNTDHNPPAGALVFWKVLGDGRGHVGISEGNGSVISTKGNGSDLPTDRVRRTGVTIPGLQYRGWAPAPSSWPGR